MAETAGKPSPRRYSLAHLVLLVPWVALGIDAWAPIRDNSFLWHIRAGDLQLADAGVLTEDPFSFTLLGERWLTQSWLAELFYAWAEQVSGLAFVPWMLSGAMFVFLVAIGVLAYRYSGSVAATAVVSLLTATVILSFVVPRPVVFSYVLFPLVALAWSNPKLRWTLPFLMWIWASTHGSFVLGLGYIGLVLIVDKAWKWMPTAILSGLVTLLTAHGVGVVEVLLAFSEAQDTLALLSEWRRPEWVSLVFTPFLVGVAIIVVGAWRRRVEPRHLFLVVPFLAIGLGSTRSVPPAWLGLLPIVALSLGGWGSGLSRRFGTVSTGVFASLVLILPFVLGSDAKLDEERFPLSAEAELSEDRVFHDDRVGGYLIYSQGPDRLVYIDDRAELYLDRMAEFVAVRDGDLEWEPVFERDGIEQALLRSEDRLVEDLESSGWVRTHADESFVVLTPTG